MGSGRQAVPESRFELPEPRREVPAVVRRLGAVGTERWAADCLERHSDEFLDAMHRRGRLGDLVLKPHAQDQPGSSTAPRVTGLSPSAARSRVALPTRTAP